MGARLVAAVRNSSLQKRILALCLLIAAFCTVLVATFSYLHAGTIVQQTAYERASQTVGQASTYIDEQLRRVQRQGYYLISDGAFSSLVLGEASVERGSALSSLQSSFSSLRLREPAIANVYLYTPRGDYYDLTFRPQPDRLSSQTFQQAQQTMPLNRWLAPRQDELFAGSRTIIPLVIPLHLCEQCPFDPQNHSFMIINVSAQYFEDYLRTIEIGDEGLIYIATDDLRPGLFASSLYGDLIDSPEFQRQLDAGGAQGSFDYRYRDELFVVNYAAISTTGWRVVGLQPQRALTAGLGAIQRITLLIVGLALVLSLLLSGWLAATITRPLATLRRLMRQVSEQGQLEVRFQSRYHDEVGELGRAFDKMLADLRALIGRVEQEEHAKRVAELAALQAQINPHFLYNTLDSIYWKIMLQDSAPAAEMVLSLSKLFRLGLNGGREITTLGQEFDHVRNYLEIQKLCYGERFTYRLHLADELARLPMLKIVLQPLVENSLVHGFGISTQQGASPGLLEIAARLDEELERLTLEVVDNGCGFDATELERALEEPVTADSGDGGYGLRNVHKRLRLHYGAGYAIELRSEPYASSVVRISLPWLRELER